MPDRLVPSTIDELEGLLDEGLLIEDHYTDFKVMLPAGGKSNKSFSKDLAAFAVDGGVIYLGVAENDDGTPASVSPVDLSGLKERIDQIARSAVMPPLAVRCIELQTVDDPSRGCVVVVVPPSPQAPHMAVERLWARGDTTNFVMPPEQARSHYNRIVERRTEIATLVEREIDRDPTPPDTRSQAHLFVVAQPEFADDDMFRRSLVGENFSEWAHKTLVAAMPAPSLWAPDVKSFHRASPRATGWATHCYGITADRRVRDGTDSPDEASLSELEIGFDGGIRTFVGRASDVIRAGGARQLIDMVVAGTVLRTIEAATAVADECQYLGSWQLGVGLSNMSSVRSWRVAQDFMTDGTPYSADMHIRGVLATYEDLGEPLRLVDELTGQLFAGLGSSFSARELAPPQ